MKNSIAFKKRENQNSKIQHRLKADNSKFKIQHCAFGAYELSISQAIHSPPSLDLWSLARARRGGVSREAARGWGFPLSQDKPEPLPIGAQAPYTRLHPHACGKRAAPAGNNRSGP